MSRIVLRTAVIVGVLIGVGCGEQPTEQSPLRQVTELDGLRLETSLDRSTLSMGDSGVLTIRLRNGTAVAPVSLPIGGYRAYAKLGVTAPGVELRSPTIAFDVR